MNSLSFKPLQVGDTTLLFPQDQVTGRLGFTLYPTALRAKLAVRRKVLNGLPYIDAIPDAGIVRAAEVDALVQVKLVGEAYSAAFAQGHTMRAVPALDAYQPIGQTMTTEGDLTTLITELKNPAGLILKHHVQWRTDVPESSAITVFSSFHNGSTAPVSLEMLSSFSLGGITPFAADDAPNRLRVHRFRSVWSAEGRHESVALEDLHLERSWSGAGAFSERFGQIGSMPVRKWFPFVAVEDTVTGVFWGAQLAWAGSWQMEIFRQHDEVALSGGWADREFGHWLKTLAPGESITTPPAVLACVQGTLDDLCDRLTATQNRAVELQPTVEQDLPIIVNEWCTSWGDPQHDKVVALADELQRNHSAAKYLIIDAGWYKGEGGTWNNAQGDWIPSSRLFPKGLAATAAAIRERGFIPGLWFEMETCGTTSVAFSQQLDLLLHRDGLPLEVRERRFWDLRQPKTVEYLSAKVIDLLESCGFGYLKVDYNETIGLGCDGAESLGEGLRAQIEGVHRFFELIRQRLPNLVIENCSSGGHRLEPSMLARTAMSSFSDAHELVEIPLIAAGLHRLLLPRQSQIWAVLHASDSAQRLVYSLAATFLGRMCLSGELDRLAPEQWAIIHQAEMLYQKVAPLIKNGVSRLQGHLGKSWRYPTGWQALVRTNPEQTKALVIVHAYQALELELVDIAIHLPQHGWRIVAHFHDTETAAYFEGDDLKISFLREFSGAVIHLTRSRGA